MNITPAKEETSLLSQLRPGFNTFLCKIASRCNLDCGYCYMYKHVDQSWRRRPRFMSRSTISAFAKNLSEYAAATKLSSVIVLLHGGEPLLAGEALVEDFVTEVRMVLGAVPGCAVEFAMQTNGTLLTECWLEVLDRLDVTFGISLDGNEEANNRWRLDHAGRSSYEAVIQTLRLVQGSERGRRLFRGILAVIDVRNDPISTYQHLKHFSPPRLDFLFPEGTHEVRPPFLPQQGQVGTPYADWLIAVFEEWFRDPGSTRIRLFENLIDVILGGRSQTEGVGEGHLNLLTIETDGEIEDVDLLKAAYPSAGALTIEGEAPANVATHSFGSLASTEGVSRRHRLHTFAGLCDECQRCPIMRVCGGGFIAHRWSRGRGFDNPSVYCRDLYKLITHIEGRVGHELVGFLSQGIVKRGVPLSPRKVE